MNNLNDAPVPIRSVDLRKEVCPMTFYKAKLHLSQIKPGELIEFLLTEGSQIRDVPRGIKDEGHRIENVRKDAAVFHLLVRKKINE